MSKLREGIQHAINCVSAENGSDTPDFILAEYLNDCLAAYDRAVTAREKWYGRERLAGWPPATLPEGTPRTGGIMANVRDDGSPLASGVTPAREADQQEACQKCRRHGDSVNRSVSTISTESDSDECLEHDENRSSTIREIYPSLSEWLHDMEHSPDYRMVWDGKSQSGHSVQDLLVLWIQRGRPHIPWPKEEDYHSLFAQYLGVKW